LGSPIAGHAKWATGLYQAWFKRCPLVYASGNASGLPDILGTWLLAILAGHKRYAHITALRGDGVCPELLGMTKIISEDALRRALARMDAEQSANWLKPQLLKSVQGVLDQPWIRRQRGNIPLRLSKTHKRGSKPEPPKIPSPQIQPIQERVQVDHLASRSLELIFTGIAKRVESVDTLSNQSCFHQKQCRTKPRHSGGLWKNPQNC